ncbi:MAG: hypothetical protein Q4E09_05240 [Eubacteriales bacterium]|nr:hypothetical protein [Eubacteriales bacterium]
MVTTYPSAPIVVEDNLIIQIIYIFAWYIFAWALSKVLKAGSYRPVRNG